MFDDLRLNETYPTLSTFSSRLAPPSREIIGREKEKLSLMSALSRPELCNAILLAPAGTGKAHPNDELVAVDDMRGYIRIGLLVNGDRVFGEDGQPVTVTGVFPRGRLRAYVVRTQSESVRCNDEHLWTVRDSLGGDEWVTLTLREIVDQGLVTPEGSPRWELPSAQAVSRQDRQLPIEPYVLGVLIGHGVGFTAHDELALDTVSYGACDVARIEEATGWSAVRHDDGTVGFTDADGQVVTQTTMTRHPVLTSVFVKDAPVRRVPHLYMTSSPMQRQGLLDGLHATGTETWLCQQDIHELERSLGHKGDYIVEVEDTGEDTEMTCIMVDSPTHLYQVGRGYVVTHNTALVQACMVDDTERTYLEIDMARMIANLANPEEMASRLKSLFDEAERFSRDEDDELVLFIDEFHQVVQLSQAAVEALKPLLAASGARGIKVIAATTYDEFDEHISANLPLVERLARINIPPTDREVTIQILKGMAQRYEVADKILSDALYAHIYEYTNRYVPASVQPRKSIRVLDAMVGRHRYTGERMDKHLLATVLKTEFDVEVEIAVDAVGIKKQLDQRVFSQDFATSTIARRLQLCVAGINNPDRPMASLLLTGATGTGKTEVTKQLSQILFGDDQRHLIRFDMTEWGLNDHVGTFREELTRAVWATNHCVLLFDEIEKAAPLITLLLLQILDDGRLSDKNGRQVSFLNSYIVMTTNAGSEIYRTIGDYKADDTGSEEVMKEYEKIIQTSIKSAAGNRFPPELLGRIDAIVPFQPLSRTTLRKITYGKLVGLREMIKRKHGIDVHIDKRVMSFLIDNEAQSDSDAGGARDMVRRLDRYVTTEIAAFINAHPDERSIDVSIDGIMRSDDVRVLKSDAVVVVKPSPSVYESGARVSGTR